MVSNLSTEDLDDLLSFDNYCIVCDRLIIPPKDVEPVNGAKTKKKAAGGTIRVSSDPNSFDTIAPSVRPHEHS